MQINPLGAWFAFFVCKTSTYSPTLLKSVVKIINCNVLKKFSCNYHFLLLTINLDFEEMMLNNSKRKI